MKGFIANFILSAGGAHQTAKGFMSSVWVLAGVLILTLAITTGGYAEDKHRQIEKLQTPIDLSDGISDACMREGARAYNAALRAGQGKEKAMGAGMKAIDDCMRKEQRGR